MKLTTKQVATAGIMLALGISSQYLQIISSYLTGPVINLILIVTTLYCGMLCGTIVGIITPITSFLISNPPIMTAIPAIIPCIMVGNIILVLSVGLIRKAIIALKFEIPKQGAKREIALLAPSVVIGAILKALFMSIAIVRILIPTFGTSLKEPMIAFANVQFSTTQLIAALIGGALSCIMWPAIKATTKNRS